MPAGLCGALLLVLLLTLSCRQPTPIADYGDFEGFALDIADVLATQNLERLVAQTTRTQVVCDAELVQKPGSCQGVPVGTAIEGFDVKYYGREGVTLLDSGQIRQLLDGMLFGSDFQAEADQFGGSSLRLTSTLVPDPVLWFAGEKPEAVPLRGDLAITYIGRSPSEDDEIKRRLWVAIAERGSDGLWKIRLWLVGYIRPDHPALNPSEENGFKAWQGPSP